MASLSWEEIVERGKQHNKTVICEVEKTYHRRFKIKCLTCLNESIMSLKHLSYGKTCRKCYHLSESKEQALIHADKHNVKLLSYAGKEIDNRHRWLIQCKKCNNLKESSIRDFDKCRVCMSNNQRSTLEYFIDKAKSIHGEKYSYDNVQYKNSLTKIKIYCNECNEIFLQTPGMHLSGHGCLSCSGFKKYSNEEFANKAIQIHGEKYNYSLVDYVNTEKKVKIKCLTCNEIFLQRPHNHLGGQGCPNCSYKSKFKNTNDFILKAKQIHGEKYIYDLVDYQHHRQKVKIKCNKCNQIFEQKPHNHLSGQGCPKCNESKGEIKVAQHMTEKNIRFIPQKTFQTLRNIKLLKCDFYLEDLNLLIEYDGEYHYKPVRGSTPEQKQKNLEDVQRRDKIKDEWARKNNIPLLRIPYWDYDRIEELIDAFILEHTRKKEVKQLVLEM